MTKHDWSQFKKRINIKASKEVLFEAWTSQEKLETWFLSQAKFHNKHGADKPVNSTISIGDTYSWMWHGSDFIAEGKVFENNGENIIGFTFLGCDVRVEIIEEDGENIVELTQSEIPLDEDSAMSHFVGCTRGWTFFMTNLKSIVEGGVDLRNKNGNLANMINT